VCSIGDEDWGDRGGLTVHVGVGSIYDSDTVQEEEVFIYTNTTVRFHIYSSIDRDLAPGLVHRRLYAHLGLPPPFSALAPGSVRSQQHVAAECERIGVRAAVDLVLVQPT
jgi:hypothetical protein